MVSCFGFGWDYLSDSLSWLRDEGIASAGQLDGRR